MPLRSLSSRLFTLQTRQRARSRSVPYPHCQNKWSPSSEVPRRCPSPPLSLSLSLSRARANQNRSHAETGLPRPSVRPSVRLSSPSVRPVEKCRARAHTHTHTHSCSRGAFAGICSAARLSASGELLRGNILSSETQPRRGAPARRGRRPSFRNASNVRDIVRLRRR